MSMTRCLGLPEDMRQIEYGVLWDKQSCGVLDHRLMAKVLTLIYIIYLLFTELIKPDLRKRIISII